MEGYFKGKRALVTGAGQGIGKAIAKELAKLGSEVLAVTRTSDHLVTLCQEVPGIIPVPLDVSCWDEAEATIKSLLPVQLLVNNAGISSLQPVGEVTESEFDAVFAVNVKAALNISQVVARDLRQRHQSGAIVNISSQASMVALADHTVYCASKAALDQITKVLALELGPSQIRVNSVNPTVTLTDMARKAWGNGEKADAMKAKIPLGKFCEPEDVVNAVLFLLSDKATMITGTCLPIDGGYTIH